MTDKRIKIDCPFCHTKAKDIQIVLISQKCKLYDLHCPKCGCSFFGEGKQNLIDKWNTR